METFFWDTPYCGLSVIIEHLWKTSLHSFPLLLDGWTTDDLKYQWKKDDPVQITHDLHLPRFTLEKYVSDYCNIKTNTGN